MHLSIVIVNWNSASYAKECIASLRNSTGGLQYEVIVVDNASSDNSVEMLSAIAGIRLIASRENLGFARANNLGFSQSSGDVVLFLNPDTKVLGDAIAHCYTTLLSSPETGIAGCKLLNADLSIQTSCIQNFPTLLNQFADAEALRMKYQRSGLFGIWPLFDPNVGVIATVQAISGAFLMIRRGVFEEIGRFSSEYFMYAEDLDLCYKASKSGWKVSYVPGASVLHYGGQSAEKTKTECFGDIASREAIHMFLVKTRGAFYAGAYRVTMGTAAVFRICLLTILRAASFTGKPRYRTYSATKWRRILRWSLGLESWARRLRAPGARASAG